MKLCRPPPWKLTLSKNQTNKKLDTESIRQSFSHGRSKTVTVEVKKRRFFGKSKYTNKLNDNIYSNRTKAGISEKEILRRDGFLKEKIDLIKTKV